jgi:hypothetical protein
MKAGNPRTAVSHIPSMGESVALTTAKDGHRNAFKVTAANGWHATFATRLAALSFADSNEWKVQVGLLDSLEPKAGAA